MNVLSTSTSISPTDRALTATVIAVPQHMRRSMHITSSAIPGQHCVLNDTGAQFSAISKRHVDANHIHIHHPKLNEVKHLSLADKSVTVPRIGYVNIPVVVHFRGGTPRTPYRCTKQFEVLNMDYDFILGVDMLPHLFKNDEIMDHLMLPSRITTPPQPLLGAIVCDAGNEVIRSAISQFSSPPTLSYTRDSHIEEPHSTTVNAINEYVGRRVSENFYHLLGFEEDDFVDNLDRLRIADTESSQSTSSSATTSILAANYYNDRQLDSAFSITIDDTGDRMVLDDSTQGLEKPRVKRVS